MMLDSSNADRKFGGDLLVDFQLGDHAHNATFGRRKIRQGGRLSGGVALSPSSGGQKVQERVTEETLSDIDGLTAPDNVVLRAIFYNQAFHPQIQCGVD